MEQIFRNPSWMSATTLRERASLFKGLFPDSMDEQLARKKEDKWTSFSPFDEPETFEQRLRSDDLSLSDFRSLVGQSPETLASRIEEVPSWLGTLQQAFRNLQAQEGDEAPEPGLEEVDESTSQGFVYLVEPLVREARARVVNRLEALIQDHPEVPVDRPAFQRSLIIHLFPQIVKVAARTMALEMQVASLQEELEGDSTEERYRSFVQRLRQPEVALEILREYPVLARLVLVAVENWTRNTLELLQRLFEDWDRIHSEILAGADVGSLVAVQGDAGDTHRQGRAVAILHFDSGQRLVYKPRSLAVEQHFQDLLDWLGDQGFEPRFRTLKVVQGEDHGWVEFVKATPCETPEELERFYRRIGGLLAILYSMEATDFHYENLIACGEHPIPIDLEALFHPRIKTGRGSESVFQGAQREIIYSVLRAGLLPQKIWSTRESPGVDLSGLAGGVHQMTPRPVPTWEGSGTDRLQLVRKRMEIHGGNNRARLQDELTDPGEYADAILAGFEDAYDLLLEHREEVLSPTGPIAAFERDTVRVIMRATRVYSTLLFESYHPDVLRNALDRDILLDRLWADIEHFPSLGRAIQSETEDMRHGDIPFFTTQPASRDLWTSRGERLPDFIETPGMEIVRERMMRLSKADLEKQRWFIEASLATLVMGEGSVLGSYPVREPKEPTGDDRLLATATRVGDRLAELAMKEDEGEVSWLGLAFVDNRHWQLLPLGLDLYNGLPGVALFLAQLGKATGESRFTELAEEAIESIQSSMDGMRENLKALGAFSGWGGLLYTFSHLSAVLGRSDLRAEAEEVLPLLPELIPQDEQLDIIGGVAGGIGGLLALHRIAPASRSLEIAVEGGDFLLERAETREDGLCWTTRVESRQPLLGFSHGASGIAWALLELARASGEERFREAAEAAIRYESRLFDEEHGNWPDFRDLSSGNEDSEAQARSFMTAWCHGAPGIGLARLHALDHLDTPELLPDVRRAIDSTLAYGLGTNHSLCHGDVGNLEFLAAAARRLNDAELEAEVNFEVARLVASIEQDGFRTGIPRGIETPGLMTGLSGIGYGLLHLAAPERVPSVLRLDAPVAIPTVSEVTDSQSDIPTTRKEVALQIA